MDRRGALKVKDMSFSIKQGEIFGIAGVEGNGQSELIDAIIGFLKPASGRVFYDGKDITGISTSEFRKEPIGYIPDDRNLRGSSLRQSVAENFIICSHSGKEFNHNKIIEQRNKGAAVLLISAELTEIMGLSDKIGMLYNGELVAIRENDDTVTEKEIGKYILNGRQDQDVTEE